MDPIKAVKSSEAIERHPQCVALSNLGFIVLYCIFLFAAISKFKLPETCIIGAEAVQLNSFQQVCTYLNAKNLGPEQNYAYFEFLWLPIVTTVAVPNWLILCFYGSAKIKGDYNLQKAHDDLMKNCSLGGKKGSKDDDKAKVEKDTFYVDNFVQSPEKEVLLNRTTNMIKLLEKKLKKVYWGPDRSTNLDDVIVVFASTIIIFAYLKAVFGLDCTFFIRFFWELSVEGIDFTKLENVFNADVTCITDVTIYNFRTDRGLYVDFEMALKCIRPKNIAYITLMAILQLLLMIYALSVLFNVVVTLCLAFTYMREELLIDFKDQDDDADDHDTYSDSNASCGFSSSGFDGKSSMSASSTAEPKRPTVLPLGNRNTPTSSDQEQPAEEDQEQDDTDTVDGSSSNSDAVDGE